MMSDKITHIQHLTRLSNLPRFFATARTGDALLAGRSIDPKHSRITVRLSEADARALASEASKRGVTVGAIVRDIIRTSLAAPDAAPRRARRK
jgi:hypothetical protein